MRGRYEEKEREKPRGVYKDKIKQRESKRGKKD